MPTIDIALTVHRERSLKNWVPCSISATCSHAAVVLTSTNSISGWSLTFSNSISIIIVRTVNHPRAYKLTTFFTDTLNYRDFRSGTCSHVYSLTVLDRVTKKKFCSQTLHLPLEQHTYGACRYPGVYAYTPVSLFLVSFLSNFQPKLVGLAHNFTGVNDILDSDPVVFNTVRDHHLPKL